MSGAAKPRTQQACNDALTTGQVARYCSVTKETIQNWIRTRGLRAQRTAGGQYRILPDDLRSFMAEHDMPTTELDGASSRRGAIRCWDFFAEGSSASRRACRSCVVHRSRAAKCYELRNYRGHQHLHCSGECATCLYYQYQQHVVPQRRRASTPPQHTSSRHIPAPPESITHMASKVVVIDDEVDSLKYLSAVLEDNGYDVVSSEDPDRGLALALTENPDLILIDIMMPGTTGLAVYRAMRAESTLREVPVILVSGVKTEQEYDFRELMADDSVPEPQGFAEKPINIPQFLAKVEEAVGARQ